jgi:hypothetical protein
LVGIDEPGAFRGLDDDPVEHRDDLVDQHGPNRGELVTVTRLHGRARLESGVGDGVVGRLRHAISLERPRNGDDRTTHSDAAIRLVRSVLNARTRHWTRKKKAVMAFTRVLAQATVSDLEPAIAWYSTLFGRPPDVRPMDGLAEWHFGNSHGVQVWEEPDRSGRSSMVLDESNLPELIARLDESGFEHGEPEDVTAARILLLEDLDGNRVVVSTALSDD